jgi:hypothetical protein
MWFTAKALSFFLKSRKVAEAQSLFCFFYESHKGAESQSLFYTFNTLIVYWLGLI